MEKLLYISTYMKIEHLSRMIRGLLLGEIIFLYYPTDFNKRIICLNCGTITVFRKSVHGLNCACGDTKELLTWRRGYYEG